MARLGVVLLNLGGPKTLDDVEPYLEELFSDPLLLTLPRGLGWLRPMLARFIARRRAPESRENYRKIGGTSPIELHTRAQAEALQAELARRGHDARVTFAMRAWAPRADVAARIMKEAEVERGVLLPLYPQYARVTTLSAFLDFEQAWRKISDQRVRWGKVRSYPTHPGWIAAVVEDIKETLAKIEKKDSAAIFFSAHGLPVSQARHPQETYEQEVNATVRAVLAHLGWKGRHHLGFQSRVGPMKWLGPDVEQVIETMVREGTKDAVVYPIAFTSDHSETLFELDILYGEKARAKGLGWHRVSALNAKPTFASALADLVEANVP